jgi:fatty acid desaturase
MRFHHKTHGRFFAYTAWDALPALSGVLNFAFVICFYLAFAHWRLPWWALVGMGFTYSVSIGWNINSVCHNFVHNPFFTSNLLNRLFSLMQSLASPGEQ